MRAALRPLAAALAVALAQLLSTFLGEHTPDFIEHLTAVFEVLLVGIAGFAGALWAARTKRDPP